MIKQFTTRWPDVARSDADRSPLPAAVVGRRTRRFTVRDSKRQALNLRFYFEDELGAK